MIRNFSLFLFFSVFLLSCGVQKQIGHLAGEDILNNASLQSAHIGISVYDPVSNQYLYNYQGDKYFVPASNTKLFSLYAGMKYLGDSLTGIRYVETDTAVFLLPTADPTLLHADYYRQPVIDFLKRMKKKIYITDAKWEEQALGAGWAWDDYNDDYMVERNALPVYGNMIKWVQENQKQQQDSNFDPSPVVYSVPEVNWKVRFTTGSRKNFFVKRKKDENIFDITQGNEAYKAQDVPFVTNGLSSAIELLKDTIGKEMLITDHVPAWEGSELPKPPRKASHVAGMSIQYKQADQQGIIHSQPADSLFVPMMYRSDNFFAEQTLLMVSNEKLGIMNDEKIIDTLLKTDLKELPQQPSWADGSGLSRFNLFTPNDFVWLLNKMKNEFGIDRMKRILPTGGTGTLRNYYKKESGYIFAKTGSLSNVICLSGYVYTMKNRLLIFSVLVNNQRASGATVRGAVEKFIVALRQNH